MSAHKKYFTEEERKEARREYGKNYREQNKERIQENRKKWYAAHRDEQLVKLKKYYRDNWDKSKAYREERKEEINEHKKTYRQENKEKVKAYKREYRKRPIARAQNLVGMYRLSDRKYNRGECTITAKWVCENIFTKPCYYCGETDWHKLGCDRIDNSKPHTPENVVCSCGDCNNKRHHKNFEDFLKEIGRA